MKGEVEALLAAHPPPSSWLLHPLLQRGPMMVSPSLFAPTPSTNPIPASRPNRAQVLPAATYWETRTSVYIVLEKTTHSDTACVCL